MNRPLFFFCLFFIAVAMAFSGMSENAFCGNTLAETHSDSFDTFREDWWSKVTRLSPKPGKVEAADSILWLEAPYAENMEIQVVGKFTLKGDFDLVAPYVLDKADNMADCRFNGGLVLQTAGDRASYKCYLAMAPGRELFYRARLDHSGVINMENLKSPGASAKGKIRVKRENGKVTFFAWAKGSWEKIHTFRGNIQSPLRPRFKLQTGNPKTYQNACPTRLGFEGFELKYVKKVVLDH